MDTLYTVLEGGLTMIHPFMPFLSEELWQHLPRRPGDSTPSITVASYPEYDKTLDDPESEMTYELVLDCSNGVRSLIAEYNLTGGANIFIHCLNDASYTTVSAQAQAIRALSGKGLSKISILKPSDPLPRNCDVRPISTDAAVFLDITGHINVANGIAKTEAKLQKVVDAVGKQKAMMGKDDFKQNASEAAREMEGKKLADMKAEARNLDATLKLFQTMKMEAS